MKKEEAIPQFENEEAEAEYWDKHSPLELVAEPKLERVRVTGAKDRPITIRLDSETRAKLNKLAASVKLGPSTYARLVLTQAVERKSQSPKSISPAQLKDLFEQNMPESVKKQAELLTKATAIGDPDNPSMLVIDASQMKMTEELGMSFFKALLAMVGVQVVTPENEAYEGIRDAAKSTKFHARASASALNVSESPS